MCRRIPKFTREHSFKRSAVHRRDGTNSVIKYRKSSLALIRRRQTPIVKCIEQRFSEFQGFIDVSTIEPLQVVKYRDDQEVGHRFIEFDSVSSKKTNLI